MTNVDVVVIGAGLAGSAAARALAHAGREVLLLERFELGHDHGSSHGTSRIFRFSYDEQHFVRDAMEALPLWRELEDEVGEPLIATTGGLDHGDIAANLQALQACGAKTEVLDGAAASTRWPAYSFPNDSRVLFQPDAGYTRADYCLRAFVTSATSNGAEFRTRSRVRALKDDGRRAVVETEAETMSARVAVVTVGGWVNELIATVGEVLPVEVTRQTVAYFEMDPAITFPTLVDWTDPPFYSLPAPGIGVKVGAHHVGPKTDPNEPGTVDESTLEAMTAWTRRRYPHAARDPLKAETCIYTSTSDESFIFERRGPFVIGSACSGHGFKFGPLTGRRLANLATI
jgi:sarcosine oxidase